jgi:hypothetical protein
MTDLFEQKRQMSSLRETLLQQDEAIDQARRRVYHLESLRDQIRAKAELKLKEKHDSSLPTSERLENLMSQLKAKVINYYSDCTLFHQIREKLTRGGQPVTKVFLEAHQAVKRIVVELSRNPNLNSERWPLTPVHLQRIPPHQFPVLLTAIKTMVVTFDIMDKPTRDSLTSDVEIVLNADLLTSMALMAISHRRQVLAVKV